MIFDPPAAPEGGASWYSTRAVKYKCQHGYNFEGGHYYVHTNCTPVRRWYPRELPQCVRECALLS